MAFVVTTTEVTVMGNKRVAFGTYTSNGGSTGGAVATGLNALSFFSTSNSSSSPSGVQSVISGGTATLTTAANQTGTWMAIGI